MSISTPLSENRGYGDLFRCRLFTGVSFFRILIFPPSFPPERALILVAGFSAPLPNLCYAGSLCLIISYFNLPFCCSLKQLHPFLTPDPYILQPSLPPHKFSLREDHFFFGDHPPPSRPLRTFSFFFRRLPRSQPIDGEIEFFLAFASEVQT